MTAGDIALIITAIAGLITAVAGLIASLQKKAARDAERLEKERNSLRKWVELLLRHIYALRRLLAEHGIEAPAMPDEPDETESVT